MSLPVLSTKFYLVVETYHSSPYDWVAFNDLWVLCVCVQILTLLKIMDQIYLGLWCISKPTVHFVMYLYVLLSPILYYTVCVLDHMI